MTISMQPANCQQCRNRVPGAFREFDSNLGWVDPATEVVCDSCEAEPAWRTVVPWGRANDGTYTLASGTRDPTLPAQRTARITIDAAMPTGGFTAVMGTAMPTDPEPRRPSGTCAECGGTSFSVSYTEWRRCNMSTTAVTRNGLIEVAGGGDIEDFGESDDIEIQSIECDECGHTVDVTETEYEWA